MARKLKTRPATLIDNEEDNPNNVDELLEELEEDLNARTEYKPEEVSRETLDRIKKIKEMNLKEDEEELSTLNEEKEEKFFVVNSTIVLNGIRFKKGDEVTVRPIPRFYLEHGHIRKE